MAADELRRHSEDEDASDSATDFDLEADEVLSEIVLEASAHMQRMAQAHARVNEALRVTDEEQELERELETEVYRRLGVVDLVEKLERMRAERTTRAKDALAALRALDASDGESPDERSSEEGRR